MDDDIYGPSIPHLEGKAVRRKIQHVDPIKITSVTQTILDNYKEVTIFCEIMHINGIGFLKTISRRIMFSTGIMIKTKKLRTFEMVSHRYINYTCSAVSISHICTLIVSLNHYERK